MVAATISVGLTSASLQSLTRTTLCVVASWYVYACVVPCCAVLPNKAANSADSGLTN
jgi:hypothetical protein